VTDEQVVLLADIASTGFAGAESGGVRIGDSVVVFAQGPIGLCATAGAKLMGASLVIGVDSDPVRLAMAKRMGADVALDFTQVDVVEEVKRLTAGYGADVAIEALGTQQTFESALRSLRPGGTLSSLGVYSGKLQIPYDAFAAGLGDNRIVTTLCPGGKERMGRLIRMVQSGRFDPRPLITHRFSLAEINEAYRVFSNRLDGVLKVAVTP
jgi:threonine dehydrogenase-like Zn-dependent dehydrogenase